MHSSSFPGTFSSNYLMYICMGKLQNIYFNMKDSEHFGKCSFLFLYQGSHLLLFVDTLLCKTGVWGLLKAPEAITLLTVKCAFSNFSWYFFFKKFNLHLCRHIHKISKNIKLLGILTNLFFKIGLVCKYISLQTRSYYSF